MSDDWRSEKRQRTHLVAVRLTPTERDAIVAAAAADGMSLSGYMRECALWEATRL